MGDQVLVTYASKYGSTMEIADKIHKVLLKEGLKSTLQPVEQIDGLNPYTAVVLGSAVYFGQWRKSAAGFLKAKEAELAKKRVWLFSSGPPGNEMKSLQGWKFPANLQGIADQIDPREVIVFPGAVDLNKLNPIEKLAMKALKATSSDYRDWDAITSWAKGIAKSLK
jgi:menaquinone-dependent protoporphyrinogen oxidase